MIIVVVVAMLMRQRTVWQWLISFNTKCWRFKRALLIHILLALHLLPVLVWISLWLLFPHRQHCVFYSLFSRQHQYTWRKYLKHNIETSSKWPAGSGQCATGQFLQVFYITYRDEKPVAFFFSVLGRLHCLSKVHEKLETRKHKSWHCCWEKFHFMFVTVVGLA